MMHWGTICLTTAPGVGRIGKVDTPATEKHRTVRADHFHFKILVGGKPQLPFGR